MCLPTAGLEKTPHVDSPPHQGVTPSTTPSQSSDADTGHSERRRRRRRRRRRKYRPAKETAESSSAERPVPASPLPPTEETHASRRPTSPRPRRTPPADRVSDADRARYVGLDCEMVGTGPDGRVSALARVSLVDWDGRPTFDTFVRVPVPVTDWRTPVSGITRGDLEAAETPDLEACRALVLDRLRGKILVGHGLKHDLRVLGVRHPWHAIRDTARYAPLMRADPGAPGVLLPRKLKELAKNWAGKDIQREGESHCPVEDAGAAMLVFRAKRDKWEKAIQWKVQKTEAIQSSSNSDGSTD